MMRLEVVQPTGGRGVTIPLAQECYTLPFGNRERIVVPVGVRYRRDLKAVGRPILNVEVRVIR